MSTTPEIDWPRLYDEAIETLTAYLRVDTSNPPGRERIACAFLGAILDREGIPYELFDAGNDRVSLRAVLHGDGSKRPFMLLNHMDVVPVQREYWDEEPFAGIVKDGHIWGRGTLDMKSLGVAELMTFLTLKRLGVALARDVVFFAMADEEAGGEFGMRWINREHPEALDAEYVINEGAAGSTELFGMQRPVVSVAVSEKGPLWLRLVTEGRPGHASVPQGDNGVDRLVRALHRIQHWERPLVISPILLEYFERLQRAGIYRGEATEAGLVEATERDPRLKALLSNTISATTLTAGIKHNVIPARAEATIDVRLLPGVRADDFQADLAGVIDDPAVRIERVYAGSSDANPFDTELFRTIEDVVHAHVEDAVVVPSIDTWFTDSSVLRNRGIVAYGFSGQVNTPEITSGVHGNNERISVESFRQSLSMVFEVTRRMCAR
ncbi:MAG: M20/M25/M40 family metallo-hydrolase [Chloroflexi bacterium]|nr:M20/M25/M40 family metallo-hydrolase [Chloroflexota bacterium]